MFAYRIGGSAHPLLDGSGACASDHARWNSRGRYIIYAAEHYATALLERAAQLNSVPFPPGLLYIRVEIPSDAAIEELAPEALGGWDADDKSASQAYGDRWYDEKRSLVLIVPSLAAPGIERTVLINQRHAAFARVKASPAAPCVCHPMLRLRG